MTQSEDPSTQPETVDPRWWDEALGANNEPNMLLLSEHLRVAALAEATDSPKRRALEVLHFATSPILNGEDWVNPFTPAITLNEGRTVIPSDLTADHLDLLARIAPFIQRADVRARAADIAWTFGGRRNQAMLWLAIDSYRESPLEFPAWHNEGRESWKRALELTLRRGKAEKSRRDKMKESITARFMNCTANDKFFTVELSQVLFSYHLLVGDEARSAAEHCRSLALAASPDQRLTRALLRQASGWLGRLPDSDSVSECQAAIAEAYAAEADQRINAEDPSALVAGHFLEKAVATLADLPNRYRQAHGLDTRLIQLRKSLRDVRLRSLDEMVPIESEALEITDYISYARSGVQGYDTLEALARLGDLHPLIDAERAFASAEERVRGSISHMFARSTFAYDGRKVASSPGSAPRTRILAGESPQPPAMEDPTLWAEVIREFDIRVQLAGKGIIVPAMDVINSEHQISKRYLYSLCQESPFIPTGQVTLWSLGLWHGITGDYASAATILIPLLEQFVRIQIKLQGAHTLLTDENGVESEKGLSALLRMPEATEALGVDLMVELRSLLCEQGGANLRNVLAHGLITDGLALSYYPVYAWWLSLRIAIRPVYRMHAHADDNETAGQTPSEASDDLADDNPAAIG